MKTLYESSTPDEQLLDQLTAQALSDADYWFERLETMQGQHAAREAHKRAASIGFERLVEQLDAIGYPPLSTALQDIDPTRRWTTSEAEKRVETRYEPGERGRAIICIRSLEALQRAKATTQFWEQLAGIHPRDAASDPDGFSLQLAWEYFIQWKAYATLAKRSIGHRESSLFTSLAKAYRLMTAQFLASALSEKDLKLAVATAAT